MLTATNSELETALDDIASAKEVLEEAYTPEGSREQLAAAIGKALDILEAYDAGNEADGEDSESEEDNEDDV